MASLTAKITGAKFFQNRLDALRLWISEATSDEQLPASALATYILYHFECDDYGRILAKDFCLKHTAEEYDLPHTSIHNGHHRLIESGWIKEEWINGELYYAISKYEELNNPERNNTEKLSYFIIPKFILKHAVLAPFISSRDAAGIIGMLELINGLYRQFRINPTKQSIKRETEKLVQKMKKTARSFKQWVTRIQQVFNISIDEQVKKKEEQWIFEFVDGCFEESQQDPELTKILSAIRKDITHHFTHSNLAYKKQHIQNVYFACKEELVDLFFFLPNRNEAIRTLHTDTMKEILLEINNEYSNIKTIGAYYRTILRKKVIGYIRYQLDYGERLDLNSNYNSVYKKIHRNLAAAYDKLKK
jgi:hypothetical protein